MSLGWEQEDWFCLDLLLASFVLLCAIGGGPADLGEASIPSNPVPTLQRAAL